MNKKKFWILFYAPNEGDPLKVAKEALICLRKRYEEAGAELEILSAGTTGYGEMLFSKAFEIPCHTVETVAHARASEKYVKDASFILDIGGQDMKAIWLEDGVITNILLNEAVLFLDAVHSLKTSHPLYIFRQKRLQRKRLRLKTQQFWVVVVRYL